MYKLEVQFNSGNWSYVGHYGSKKQAIHAAKHYEKMNIRVRITKTS
jgi:hypothetical protein